MNHPTATRVDLARLAFVLLLVWGVLAPSVACTSRAAGLGDRLDRLGDLEAR